MTPRLGLVAVFLGAVVGLVGCKPKAPATIQAPQPAPAFQETLPNERVDTPRDNPLLAARRGHKVVPVSRGMPQTPLDIPPKKVFGVVKYPTAVGDLPAYLTPDPKDGKKHPAIIWITGGDCNTIGDVWSPAEADNDQTAAQFRQAGVVMMFPSLRGGNTNPGQREGYFGEVDDVLAAREFLANQPHVDPDRIYLGGHSTGGTLALLVAETGADFRCVFSFGPVEDVTGYGPTYCPFDMEDDEAVRLRSPEHWLSGIRSRTLVMEGLERGNAVSVMQMNFANTVGETNPHIFFYTIGGGNHFNILAPLNGYLARQVVADTGPICEITLPRQQSVGGFEPTLLNNLKR